jgi:hypothetical protein
MSQFTGDFRYLPFPLHAKVLLLFSLLDISIFAISTLAIFGSLQSCSYHFPHWTILPPLLGFSLLDLSRQPEFCRYFTDNVDAIRAFTANARELSSATAGSSFTGFQPVSVGDIIASIGRLPDKVPPPITVLFPF